MRILLLTKDTPIEPLGVMFLGAYAIKYGHEVDYLLVKKDSKEILENLLQGSDYDYVGFSIFTGFHKEMFEYSKLVQPYSTTVIGGPHATFFGKECLGFADYVVAGEGYKGLLDVLNGQAEKSKLIFYSDLLDVENIPSPDRRIYLSYPNFRESPIKSVMASFGCPYACTYCFNDSYRKLYPEFKVRIRDVDVVVDECESLKRFGTQLIFFQDDCFGFDIKWLEEFAWRYKGEIPFHCQIRPEVATEGRLKLLRTAGCHGITLAIETSNENTRVNFLNRKMTNNQIMLACKKIKEMGFKLRTEQMLGLPETSFEDELQLLRMNMKINPDIAWTSMFSPYLGTSLGDYCKSKKIYKGNNDDLSDNFFDNTRLEFSPERAKKTNMLQNIFSTCVKIPYGDKLVESFLDKEDHSFKVWFSVMRKHLYDNCLYKVR